MKNIFLFFTQITFSITMIGQTELAYAFFPKNQTTARSIPPPLVGQINEEVIRDTFIPTTKDPGFWMISIMQPYLPKTDAVQLYLNFKFNYINRKIINSEAGDTKFLSSYIFSFINGEINTHDRSISSLPTTGMLNINSYLPFEYYKKNTKSQKIRNGIRWNRNAVEVFSRHNRLPFAGVGMKIFEGKVYLGGHLGSVEIGTEKVFQSSYFMAGWYKPLARSNTRGNNILLEADIGISTNYLEKNLTFKSSKSVERLLKLLLSARLKIEFFQPLASNNELTWQESKLRMYIYIPLISLMHY